MRPITAKRRKAQEKWNAIVQDLVSGGAVCKRCGKAGTAVNPLVGHHKRHRAGCPSRDIKENCEIVHFYKCHEEQDRIDIHENYVSKTIILPVKACHCTFKDCPFTKGSMACQMKKARGK